MNISLTRVAIYCTYIHCHSGAGPRPTSMMVKTNYYKMDFCQRMGVEYCWHHYMVEIKNAVRSKDENRKFLFEDDGTTPKLEEHPRRPTFDLDKGSTPLSIRIIAKVCKQVREEPGGSTLIYDGSAAAYCERDIIPQGTGTSRTFAVKTKKDCEDGDPYPEHEDADRMKNSWFLVVSSHKK